MNDIKFRAWDKTFADMEMDVQSVSSNRIIGTSACESFQEVIDSWEFLVMQYSGIKDEKSVEIYQGDIIKGRISFTPVIAIVKLGDYTQDGSGGEYNGVSCLGFYGEVISTVESYEEHIRTSSLFDFSEIQVIGNIHANPELLLLKGEVE